MGVVCIFSYDFRRFDISCDFAVGANSRLYLYAFENLVAFAVRENYISQLLPTQILIKLADFHNVSTDYILGRTDNPKMIK